MQIILALTALSITERALANHKLKNLKSKKFQKHELSDVLIEKDESGKVVLLSITKDGKAMQYTWNHRN
jgi:hypothetical protein